jgi:hypothetical protein
VTDYI